MNKFSTNFFSHHHKLHDDDDRWMLWKERKREEFQIEWELSFSLLSIVVNEMQYADSVNIHEHTALPLRNLLTGNYVNWCKISQCENVAIILTYNSVYIRLLCVFNISYFFLLSLSRFHFLACFVAAVVTLWLFRNNILYPFLS